MKRPTILLMPICAIFLGAYLGLAQAPCPTCTANADNINGGVQNGANKCYASACQQVQGSDPADISTSIQQSMQAKCSTCNGYTGGTVANCPAQTEWCGYSEAVLCEDLGDC